MTDLRREDPAGIPTLLAWERIALGRGALAQRRSDGAARLHDPRGAMDGLFALLWHADAEIRRGAALALAGGNHREAYSPAYGHFANSLLRNLAAEADTLPESAADRNGVLACALRALLHQNIGEIRGMMNMRYSFLGSALYLALLSTCRDTLEAIRRARAAPAHPEVCRLLWDLTHRNRAKRLNASDVELLAHTAGSALAALPPDEIPEFWQQLAHPALTHRQAALPALACLANRQATLHLAQALDGQQPQIAEAIIGCLRRLEDPRALPALLTATENRHPRVRERAQAAILAIERAARSQSRTLLRPVGGVEEASADNLLRPLPAAAPEEWPEELLRPAEP